MSIADALSIAAFALAVVLWLGWGVVIYRDIRRHDL